MVHRKFVLKAAAISRQSSGRNGEGSDAGGSDAGGTRLTVPPSTHLFLFLFLTSSSATQRRHSSTPSATRSSAISSGKQSLLGSHGVPSTEALGAARHDVRSENQEGLPSRQPKRTTARTAAAITAAVHHPTFFLFFNSEFRHTAANAHTISDPLFSDLVRETVPARLPRRPPIRKR